MSDLNFKQRILETLTREAARLAEARGLYLLRIVVRGAEQNPVIEVLLDGARQVTIDDCESVSRDLTALIETGTQVKGNYRLDVLSPGVEEPLVYDWQFERNLGRMLEVQLTDEGSTTTQRGRLKAYGAGSITLEVPPAKQKRLHPAQVPTGDGEVAPATLVELDRAKVSSATVVLEFR